jgi:hypothetical protein
MVSPGHAYTSPDIQTRVGMATAGRIVFEGKIAVDIILAEDGKYCVD